MITWTVFLAFVLLAGLGLAVPRLLEYAVSRIRTTASPRDPDNNASPPGEHADQDSGRRSDNREPTPAEAETLPRGVLESIATGFLCGIATTGLAGQLTISLGFRLTRVWWTGFALLALTATLLAGALDYRLLRDRWRRFRLAPFASLPRHPISWILMILTGLGLVWSFRQAAGLPIVGWDPLSFWYLKTKILLHEGTVFCPDFLDANRFHAHTDYPLLVNIVEAGVCQALGEYREHPLKFLLAVWQAACLVLAGTAMARRRSAGIGWATVALVALLPALTDFDTTGATSGYRDAPLALAVLAAACVGLECVEAPRLRPRDAARFVLLLVLLTGTKREGTVWAFLLGLLVVGAAWRMASHRQCAGDTHAKPKPTPFQRASEFLLLFMALPLALMLPWYVVRAQLPYPRSENFMQVLQVQGWDVTAWRTTLVLAELRDELFIRLQKWGVLWWMFAAIGLWRRARWSPRERLLALLVPAGWAVASAGFVFTPWDDPKTHMAVSIDRLVLQGALLAVWLTVLNLTSRVAERTSAVGPLRPPSPSNPISSTAHSRARTH